MSAPLHVDPPRCYADEEEAMYPLGTFEDEVRSPYRAAALYLAALAIGLLSAHGTAAGWW